MSAERGAPRARRSYRLTTRGDAQAWRAVPWVVVVPLAGILGYIVATGRPGPVTVVPAVGVALAIVIVCLPVLVALSPDARSWSRRTASIGPDGLTVERPGREVLTLGFDGISRVHTHPETLGLRIPPVVRLVTDFYGADRRRIPELAVHHSSYRYAVRGSEVNPDGPLFLVALEDTPMAASLDLATRALAWLVVRSREGDDGLSERTMRQLERGRLWHARRSAVEDELRTERVPDALVRIDLVLAEHAVETAHRAFEERPDDPMVRYHLAHALLASVGSSDAPGPHAVEHRADLRAEARALLEGLRGEPEYGPDATRDLDRMGPPTAPPAPREEPPSE